MQHRLDCDKLSDPTRLSIFGNAVTGSLELSAPDNVNEHWLLIETVLYCTEYLVSCGLIRSVLIPWKFDESLHLLDAS